MRPIRRAGHTPDVLWDQGVILIRRSHTLGDEFMNTTKTKLRQRITVPAEVMEVLRWHADTQLDTPAQKASDLLFAAEDGGFRSESFLKKAFVTVGGLVGLKKKFTPYGAKSRPRGRACADVPVRSAPSYGANRERSFLAVRRLDTRRLDPAQTAIDDRLPCRRESSAS